MHENPGRFIIIVLDGFGVGAMPDAPRVRPRDVRAHTCRHVFERNPELRLPVLEQLGLVNAAGPLSPLMRPSDKAISGRAMLMHFGADTFFGHQEIMGSLPRKPFAEPFRQRIDATEQALLEHGFRVRRHTAPGGELLVAEEVVTIADNLEADPGQAINVTAALDHIDFARVLDIARVARGLSRVPRVIAFGGRGLDLDHLLAAVEARNGVFGVNAPASGVYKQDYHCAHLGYGVDPDTQIQSILGRAGIPAFLLGKAADVLANPFGRSFPMVETGLVLSGLLELLRENPVGFFCANVQETDLRGHEQDPTGFAGKLLEADAGIGRILEAMDRRDVLVVMADHGNDPCVGHPHHTREMVPLLIHSPGKGPLDLGLRQTLSDVGASAAEYFRVTAPENGCGFLREIR